MVITSGRWSCRDEPALGRWRRTMDGPDGGRHCLATGGRPADGRITVTSSPRRAVGPDCGVGQSGRLWAVLRGTKPLNHHCCHHCSRGVTLSPVHPLGVDHSGVSSTLLVFIEATQVYIRPDPGCVLVPARGQPCSRLCGSGAARISRFPM